MESEARPSFFGVPLEALVRSCKTKRRADLIQRVGEELRPSHFDVEEEEVHVHALPSRHFAHQALLSHTRPAQKKALSQAGRGRSGRGGEEGGDALTLAWLIICCSESFWMMAFFTAVDRMKGNWQKENLKEKRIVHFTKAGRSSKRKVKRGRRVGC